MHSKMVSLYEGCCQSQQAALQGGIVEGIAAAFAQAIKFIYTSQAFSSKDLLHKKVTPLIQQTYEALKAAVHTGIKTEIPAAMLQKFEQDVFVFSGMKTYSQLREASALLLDADGQLKSYAKFSQDVKRIDKTYNENYLQAEHQTATATAQSASQYHAFMQDKGRYNLQIRTAADDKVRTSHAALHNVTRADDDPYWNTVWTPFDWRCRCRIIQVLKDEHPETDTQTAQAAADKAVGKIFKFNPGKDGVIFPKKHPYYPQHCSGAKLNITGLVGYAQWLLDVEGDRCKAKSIMNEEAKKKGQSKQTEFEKLMQPLLHKNIIRNVGNDKSIKITFTKKGNAHVVNDVLNNINSFAKKDLKKVYQYVKGAQHIRSSALYKERKDNIQRFYYFYDKEKDVYYNVAEKMRKLKNGKVLKDHYLHAITNEIPKK